MPLAELLKTGMMAAENAALAELCKATTGMVLECSDGSGDKLELYFKGGAPHGDGGTCTYSNPAGFAYTNPDGEELKELEPAAGKFTYSEEDSKISLSWKPAGKKPAKHTHKVTLGADGAAGAFEPREEAEDEGEEE